MRIPKIVLISLIFACIGITTEIVFTSFSAFTQSLLAASPLNWALTGKTYAWMFFIYGTIPILFKLFQPLVEDRNIWFKVFLGVGVVYLIEFISGFLLEKTIGACPWQYTEGWHVMGLIRLDYFPFWLVFVLMVIKIYEILDHRIAE